MFGKHIIKKLSAYSHGELSAEETRRVEAHLSACERCRRAFEEIQLGIDLVRRLPRHAAPESLWNEIEAQWELSARPAIGQRMAARWPRWAAAAAALLFILGAGTLWWYLRTPHASWEVARLEGAPRVGSDRIGETGRLAVGEWLETDSVSRARLTVGPIGHVEIEPNTRIRLVRTHTTEHRLALDRGRMHATISAPPRLFVVETRAAVAVDLGCAYTLEVEDDGSGLLSVSYGWVAFERKGRESFVPTGAQCAMRPGVGPGTPYYEDASPAFRQALAKLDFEKSGPQERVAAMDTLLSESRRRDALTLWHLLSQLKGDEWTRAYDRMAGLVPPPQGVTPDGLRRGDRTMLDLWWNELGLRDAGWWRQWKGPWPQDK